MNFRISVIVTCNTDEMTNYRSISGFFPRNMRETGKFFHRIYSIRRNLHETITGMYNLSQARANLSELKNLTEGCFLGY